MSFSDDLIARRKADDELMTRPLDERIAFLVGMDIMVMKPRYGHDPRFNIQFGIDSDAYEWIVGEAFYRSVANLARETTARRLLHQIQRVDLQYGLLDRALVGHHYAREAGMAA